VERVVGVRKIWAIVATLYIDIMKKERKSKDLNGIWDF